jgi:hypothetical protein
VPGKDSGELPISFTRIASLIILGFILWLIMLRANALAPSVVPQAFVQPTSTFVSAPNQGIIGEQWADVVVSAKNANPFDVFDINEVVLRVSNAAQPDDGADSRFLVPCAGGRSIFAWAPGYEIKKVPCDGAVPYRIELTHLDAIDNSYYIWSSAVNNCNTCHGDQFISNLETGASYNEVNEWFRSGHGNVFKGRYFESMYN